MEFITEQARRKRVLHIGCVDSGLTEDRLRSGDLLHARLDRVASSVTGLDIDAEGIRLLEAAGYTDVAVANVTTPGWSKPLVGRQFDAVIVSEVVEHLSDTSHLFGELRQMPFDEHASLVITVPNAFSPSVLLALLHNEELVHPDHLCWFSYHTIRTLVEREGFDVKEVVPYTFEATQLRRSRANESGGISDEAVSGGMRNGSVGGRFQRTTGHARTVIRRLAVRALFARSAWWSDGIILVARWPTDRTLA